MSTSMQQPAYVANIFELRFEPLSSAVATRAFPCDALGHVDMDALRVRDCNEYLFARTLVGRDFQKPQVRKGN